MTAVFAIPATSTCRRRLHLRPPRAGAAAAVRRRGAPPGAAGLVSRSRARPTWTRRRGCLRRWRAGTVAYGRRAGLRGHAGRADRARARAHRRARAPSAVPGGRARQGAAGRSCCALEKAALALARRIVVTSAATARTLRCRISRCPRTRSPSPSPAPIRRRARVGRRRTAAVAQRRLDRAAQGLRHARARARASEGPRLAAHHRRADRSQPAGARGAAAPPLRETGLGDRITLVGAGWPGGAGGVVRLGRRLRHAVPLRGLRHGAGRGHGARVADRLHHRRRGGRDGARRRGHQGAARGRARSALPSAAFWTTRPAPSHGRCVLGRRPEAAALGGYGAHHRRRHQGASRHERLRRRVAGPARAGRPSLAQPRAGEALAKHFDGWRPITRRRPRLRHRLQPARHRAAARRRAALDARRPRPGAAGRRGRDGSPPGPTAPSAGTASSPVQGRQAHQRRASAAPISPATSKPRSGASANLVTASALFDLASAEFIAAVRRRGRCAPSRRSTRC